MHVSPSLMSSTSKLALSAVALSVALISTQTDAQAQVPTELEGIVITAPSPILEGSSGGAAIDVAPGTLIVVEDAFVPVTVVTDRDILSEGGANIADSLDERPGIIGTTYAPGANRPVIRGLDTYRVRIQENGIGSHDVSALSEDHLVPIDPFSAKRVEVIRGPATLRYGGQAFGGVVAVENDRIPGVIPPRGFTGEIKGDFNSVDNGKSGAFQATAGARGVAVHADGFFRRTDDYDIPGGEQFNTFVENEGGAIGASLIGSDGYIGVSVQRFNFLYGLPGEEADELMPRISGSQDRIQAKGEWNFNGPTIQAARFWFGASNYLHSEIVDEGDGDEVGALFSNDEVEGRVEIEHAEFSTGLGRLSGAIGVHAFSREMAGLSFEGDNLLSPTQTDTIAGFIFEELQATPQLKLQAALRVEHTEVSGQNRVEPLNAALDFQQFDRSFTPVSVSLGGIYSMPNDSVVSLNGQYVERAPDAAELFSAGIHEATGTFEIGDPTLDIEAASAIELGFRQARGPLRYDATAFYTRYDGFIFKSLTGLECVGGTLAGCGAVPAPGDETLDQVIFQQRDAEFFGVELGAQYDVGALFNGIWGIDGQYDFVRAKFTEGGDIPRIPPHRLGGGLFFRSSNLFARVGVLHAFDQDQIGENEIETPGYTLVSAEMSYTDVIDTGVGESTFTVGVKGENLADEEVLNHVSFKRREDVLLPGASIRLFGSLKLN